MTHPARIPFSETPRKTSLIDRAIGYFSPEKALQRMQARAKIELSSQFRGSSADRLFADWVLGTEKPTPDSYELTTLRDRSRDLNRNDPIASGATETLGVNIIGSGLTPQSAIDYEAIGINESAAMELQKQAERAWKTFCRTADAQNRLTFDEIQFLAMRKVIEDGEVFALPVMAAEPWRKISRCVELVESEYCSSDVAEYQQGILLGNRGEPKSYSFYTDTATGRKYSQYKAFDAVGRPGVLHAFAQKRPKQLRGYPWFAPAMTYFRHMADYLEAEVVSARVAACLAIFITQSDPYGQQAIQGTVGTSGNRLQTVSPGLVHYLGVGESINVADPKRPGDAFPSFLEGVFRIIGVSLGLPYELLLKDFSKTNYSSARAALLEGRRHFMRWRRWFASQFCQPIYELVLEEAFLKGLFEAPKFDEFRAEYCGARWIGGGWGWVDPVKEVEASKLAIDYGLSTYAEEAAGQGRDWEETFEQAAREKAKADELGLVLGQEKQQQPGDTSDEQDADSNA